MCVAGNAWNCIASTSVFAAEILRVLDRLIKVVNGRAGNIYTRLKDSPLVVILHFSWDKQEGKPLAKRSFFVEKL